MRVLVINASPKGERSNTMNITRAFVGGFPADTELETVELYRCDVNPCTGCYYCWKSGTGVCKIKDGVKDIHEKIYSADIIIVSFPLYFFGVPSQLKALTDRCLPLMVPYMSQSSDPYSASFHDFKDEQPDRFDTRRQKIHADFVPSGRDICCRPPDKAARKLPCGHKKAGAEFAQNLSLSDETAKKISKPILTSKGFGLLASRHFLPKDGKA